MRFWEIGLIVVNFGLLYWAVIANKKGGRGLFIPLGIAFALVIVQIVLEGGRWEMVPAYLTPLLLMAYFFIIKRKEAGRSRIAVTVQAMLLTVYLLVSVTPPAVLPVFSFEQPTGPYAVGTTVYHWVDDERRETYSDNTADRRELMAQIWYPVLIFSHGMNGYRNQNMYQLEELASHGYLVIAIDYAYEAAASVYPDGRVAVSKTDPNLTSNTQYETHIPLWTSDAAFVLNQVEKLNQKDTAGRFTDRIDLERIGMLGHSFGGAVTVQMLKNDPRVKAALSMDGGFYGPPVSDKGFGKPFFMMYSDETYSNVMTSYDEVAKQLGGVSRKAFEAPRKEYIQKSGYALAGGGISILIPGSKHASYSDLALFSPLLGLSGTNPRRDHRIVNEFSVAFFDRYLKGKDDSALQDLAAKYPEVNFKVNN